MHSEGIVMAWVDDSEWIDLTAISRKGISISGQSHGNCEILRGLLGISTFLYPAP